MFAHLPVQLFQFRLGQQSLCDTPLVGHNDNAQPGSVQLSNAFYDPGQEMKIFPAGHIPSAGRFLIDNPVTIQEYRPGHSLIPTISTAIDLSPSTALPARTHHFRHGGLGASLCLGPGSRVQESRLRKAVEKSLGARIVLGRSDINKHSILLEGKSPVFKNTR